MAVHVAILQPRYMDLILRGIKTVESRLYRSSKPPIGCARVGERVYLKQSSGPFRAIACIAAVDEHHDLTPQAIDALAKRYDQSVCGDTAYWQSKRSSRCAAFITLTEVEPIDIGPRYQKSMRAWHTLEDSQDVIFDLPVTGGALRNRYLHVSAACSFAKRSDRWTVPRSRKRLILLLPDNQTIETDITWCGHFRWRGWGRYYEQYGLHPGDHVRLISLGGRCYRVGFIRQSRGL